MHVSAMLVTAPDAVVPRGGLGMRWEPVTRPGGIRIAGHQVIVAEDGADRVMEMERSHRRRRRASPPNPSEWIVPTRSRSSRGMRPTIGRSPRSRCAPGGRATRSRG